MVGKDYVQIIDLVEDQGFDLLVKATMSRSNTPIAGTDMKLLHYCRCPVMMLRPQKSKKMRNILAAIDLLDAEETSELNNTILETARNISQIEGVKLHLLQVLETHTLNIAGLGEANRKAKERALAREGQYRMNRIELGDMDTLKHVRRGQPEKIIVEFVRRHEIDLLIMGSIARSGLSQFIVGNTAESILRTLGSSVLVVKPAWWSSA